MAIREGNEADLPALLALLRAYCEFYDSDPPDRGLEAMVRAVLPAPETEAFLLVATDAADRVVGFALNQWKWSSLRGGRVVVLDDLFVAEAARGAGHADALIEATAGVAREHGARAVVWLTAPDNRRAQTVYDRAGGVAEAMVEYELEL